MIEDDTCINELITELLTEQGYKVINFFNGEDAYQWLCQTPVPPALILLDLMMPIKNGYIFRQDQMKQVHLKDIPVIVMSADGNFSRNQLRISANDYIKKPFELLDFLAKINGYFL